MGNLKWRETQLPKDVDLVNIRTKTKTEVEVETHQESINLFYDFTTWHNPLQLRIDQGDGLEKMPSK